MRIPALLVFVLAGVGFNVSTASTEPAPEALLVVIGDSHSAYDKMPQFVAQVDRLKAEYRSVPLGILVDGDAFELGNAIALRSGGEVDLAFLRALAQRAPTVLNLGNHEMDFFGPAEAVEKIRATGVTVISGNARDRRTGQSLAPASTTMKLGAYEATIVGVVTDRVATFRAAIRPDLDLADPVAWAKKNFAPLFQSAALRVVLSHAGMQADHELLQLVPRGTLFAGAHDHLKLVRPMDVAGVYFQSGSWLNCFSVAELRGTKPELHWRVSQAALNADAPADPELLALVRRVRTEQLRPEDKVEVAHLAKAWPVEQAAGFAARAIAQAAGADVGFIGNTTFGAGLPAGAVTREDFDACVRFDGAVFTAVVDGQRLQRLLAEAAADPLARFEAMSGGEFNYRGGRSLKIDANGTYRIATTDWGAKNSARYFGEPAIQWTAQPGVQLKPAVLEALAKMK